MSGKRSIFEEVGSDAPTERSTAETGVIDRGRRGARGAIRLWLYSLFALVVVMIVVGGLTRLTDSGLSITEWNLVTGTIPPLNLADWEAEFAKYQTICEFTQQNYSMTLEEFKVIYWWEWGHRQLGRFIGVVWALGFLGFAVARRIPAGWTGRLLLLGALGGAQGAIGWWMVSSGVTECRTDVSNLRLAVHLGLAFVILGVIAWYAMMLGREERDLMQARRAKERKLYGLSTGLLHFAFLQIILGALVAGIDAGRHYTDWPLMAGQVFPDRIAAFGAWWEDPGPVQFIHRVSGYLLFIFGIVAWLRGRRSAHAHTRVAFNAMMIALTGQLVIGIVTVLMAAHWHVAILHQLLAVVLWVLILRARFLSLYPRAQSLRGA
ncbi:COX15/CtaA family protein [Roseovarius sp. SCSIO 43702]|uniref:heme A synthase n=1 Tax=Roseovarius sp. SCSIO 43702 TaxID=2823043 RepID=UPI001C7326D9|nr:heme A synthase [Roseovarius sp. SCSIO 43702]QYX55466.1 COX15/CtaA family protein [Roseovarius sp. SCSIO 43702]